MTSSGGVFRASEVDDSQYSARRIFALSLALFCAGIMLCWLRAPDALINPIVYTEDAIWIGEALRTGWLETFIDAKPGYLVWGNLILLWLSSAASQLVCSDPIICLPETVSFVSYGFFSGLATLLFFAAPPGTGVLLRAGWYLAVFLLPIGETSYEVFGRLSNIGYYLVALAVALTLLRERAGRQTRLLIDTSLLACIATNPVTVIIVIIGLCLRYPVPTARSFVARDGFLVLGAASLSVWIVLLLSGAGGTRVGEFQPESFVEVVFARMVLYPFAFPFYGMLTDFTTLVLAAALFAFILALAVTVRGWEQVRTLALVSSAFLIFWGLTILMRPSLTQQMADYSTTFPDRYFVGVNLCLALLVLFVLDAAWKRGGYARFFGATASGLLAVFYLGNLPILLEINSARPREIVTFRQQVCLSASPDIAMEKGSLVSLPVPISPMTMTLTLEQVVEARSKLDCRREFDSHFYVDDPNWENGYLRTGQPRFLLPRVAEFTSEYRIGNLIQFPDGQQRKITAVRPVDVYLDVTADGGPIEAGNSTPVSIIVLGAAR